VAVTSRAGRSAGLASAALFALLVVAVYSNPLFLRRNFAGRDLSAYNLAMEKAIYDAYARNQLPVWMPHVSGGRPLLPNPNAGALYPVRPLLSRLDFPLAMRLYPILHWIAAGLGALALLRTIGVSPAGAWVGAVTYVFSGVGVAEVFFPHIQPGMALLPIIVWAVVRPGSTAGRLVLLSFLFGLAMLAGDVFTTAIAATAAALWIVAEGEPGTRVSQIAVLAGSIGLAVLLAAPQVLATTLWAAETDRVVLGMKLQESFFYSISPFRLLELLIPFPFGATWQLDNASVWGWSVNREKAMGIFPTLYSGAFAVVAAAAAWRSRASGARFARVLLLLAVVAAVPPSLVPLYSRVGRLSSPIPLRNPEKFSVAIVFALAILAGIAWDRLRSAERAPRWVLGLTALLAALAAGAALYPAVAGRAAVGLVGDDPLHITRAADQVPRALAEAALLWTMTLVAVVCLARNRPGSRSVALLLVTLVPIAANRKIARTLSEEEVFSPSPFARILSRVDPAGAFRTLGEAYYIPGATGPGSDPADAYVEGSRRSWVEFTQALWSRGTVFNKDFDVGDFSRLNSLRKLAIIAAGYTDSAPFFGSFALRFGIRFRGQPPLSGYRRFGGDLRQDWDVLDLAEPDIRLARSWVEAESGLSAVAVLPHLPVGGIVLETGRRAAGRGESGVVRVVSKDPERLVVDTVTTAPGWLFVLRGFWNYRSVEIDGRPAEYVPAQLAFSAVAIPPGRHRIEWRELVPGAEISRFGPGLWAAFAGGLVLWSRKRQRRR
jgi:hypothetical protein